MGSHLSPQDDQRKVLFARANIRRLLATYLNPREISSWVEFACSTTLVETLISFEVYPQRITRQSIILSKTFDPPLDYNCFAHTYQMSISSSRFILQPFSNVTLTTVNQLQ
jgi:hypothetical protein